MTLEELWKDFMKSSNRKINSPEYEDVKIAFYSGVISCIINMLDPKECTKQTRVNLGILVKEYGVFYKDLDRSPENN